MEDMVPFWSCIGFSEGSGSWAANWLRIANAKSGAFSGRNGRFPRQSISLLSMELHRTIPEKSNSVFDLPKSGCFGRLKNDEKVKENQMKSTDPQFRHGRKWQSNPTREHAGGYTFFQFGRHSVYRRRMDGKPLPADRKQWSPRQLDRFESWLFALTTIPDYAEAHAIALTLTNKQKDALLNGEKFSRLNRVGLQEAERVLARYEAEYFGRDNNDPELLEAYRETEREDRRELRKALIPKDSCCPVCRRETGRNAWVFRKRIRSGKQYAVCRGCRCVNDAWNTGFQFSESLFCAGNDMAMVDAIRLKKNLLLDGMLLNRIRETLGLSVGSFSAICNATRQTMTNRERNGFSAMGWDNVGELLRDLRKIGVFTADPPALLWAGTVYADRKPSERPVLWKGAELAESS